MQETARTRNFRRRLADAGAYTVKVHGTAYSRGRPDLYICFRGRFVGIEVKEPGARGATQLQEYELKLIREAGGYAGVLSEYDDLDKFIRNFPHCCRTCLASDMDVVEGVEQSHLVCRTCRVAVDVM